jgi:large repetitive protein
MQRSPFSFSVLYSRHFARIQRGIALLGVVFLLLGFAPVQSEAQTCVYNTKILASNNPFGSCPVGVDTIIIRDSLMIDINFDVLFGGVPFSGMLLVDGGKIVWSSNSYLKLGEMARIVLINGGVVNGGGVNGSGCNSQRTIFFDNVKLASCNGGNAPHAFSDINAAGCFSGDGICCNAYIEVEENSGNPNDLTLCQPGDSIKIKVLSSGTLNYTYLWNPNFGNAPGPFGAAPQNNTSFSLSITGIFDPFGPAPAYLLTCGGSVDIKINSTINLAATTTPVPCASAPVGAIDLSVSGGTAPYKYKWSGNQTTQDLSGLTAGNYTVTVTDARGCSAVKAFTVITQDNTPPTLSCPSNVTVTLPQNTCQVTVNNITATFSDNCPAAQLTYTLSGATTASGSGQLSGTVPFTGGVTQAKYFVNDGTNTVNCSFNVTVRDLQSPTASNPATLTGVQCFAALPAPDPAVVTTEADNCGQPTVTYASQTIVPGGGGCPGNPVVVLRRYQVTDQAGNSILVTHTIQVADTEPPVFTAVPANITISCSAIPAVGTPTATDNCNGAVSISYNGESTIAGACANSYQLRRVWTATDGCGNTATAQQLITVQDVTAPVFTVVPANITVSCSAIPAAGTAVANDNCDASVTIIYNGETIVGGACPGNYVLNRKWTAEDNCGNTATAMQQITVQDVTKPVFTSVPANITVNCDAIPAPGTASANDNCDATVTVTYTGETRTDGACPDRYTLRRVWEASDDCGNIATAEQIITVQDVTKPVFTSVPANVTVSCSGIPAVGSCSANDNCDAAVVISYSGETKINGSCPGSYQLRRVWQAADNCGNTATAEQIITVQDVTKPVFTSVPSDVTVQCDAIPAVGGTIAKDNCDESVLITYDGETRVNGACPDTYTLQRKWTATDNCGNATTTVQVITVVDNTAPVFTSVPANITVSCSQIPSVGAPAATDNCDGSVTLNFLGEMRMDGNCPGNYTLKRRWSATDNCGNFTTAEQVITVQDLTKPAFSFIPADITVSCEAIPDPGTPTAIDNCDPAVNITLDGDTRTDGACPDTYIVTRRWTATDYCGNSAVASQKITVRDLTKPQFTFVPADVTVNCEAVPAMGTPTATDNCDAAVTILFDGETRTDGACPDTYTLTRRWTASDNCGNSTSAVQVIAVRDVTAPVFTNVPADITVSCDQVPDPSATMAADACDAIVTISYLGETRIDGACPDSYQLSRKWTATDNCGNSATAEQMITVQDLQAPVFTVFPVNITVDCSEVPAASTPEATDNCDNGVQIMYLGETRTNGACPDTYTLTRRWTAEDNCGNSAALEQVITVQDQEAPEFTFIPANVTVNCAQVPAVENPLATDQCDAAVTLIYLGEVRTAGACIDSYTLTRRWTAEDNCGNVTTAVQVIIVQDVEKPVFTFVPADVTVNCASIPAVGAPLATDNCDGSVTITFEGETRTDGNCPDTYTLTRRWTAVDNCGNETVAIQVIAVNDLVAPVFTFVPANITVNCEAVPTLGAPTATDDCDAAVTVTYLGETRADGPCPDTYMLYRRWMVEDNCGNTAAAEQQITVQDVTAPVFSFVPANTTVTCEAVPSVATPVATDNCAAAVTITYLGETRTDGACPDTYTLTRRWTAEDNCGNVSPAQQVIQVQDITSPVFTFVPANTTVSCEAVPAVVTPTASDNCDADPTISYLGETRTDGACPYTYTLTRRWRVEDNCGNTKEAVQIIEIQDITKPVFTMVPADITVNCENVPSVGQVTASDNCTPDVAVTYLGETRINGACTNRYELERRWIATDLCGNVNSTLQVITVQDTMVPLFTFVPKDTTVNCNALPTPGLPTATDNCTSSVLIQYEGETVMVTMTPDSYILKRVWTAYDACGNSSTAQQILTVQDTVAPMIICPADIVLIADGYTCTAVATFNAPQLSDNCSASLNWTATAISGNAFPVGVTQVTMVVTDASSNAATCQFDITVKDTTAPVLTNCPADITFTTTAGACSMVVNWNAPTVTDACDAYPITPVPSIAPGTELATGIYPVTYTATDTSGNSLQCAFVVTVKETVAPILIDCPTNITLYTDTCTAVATWTAPSFTDNCQTDTLVVNIASGSVFPETTTTVIYTASDVWGNTTTCSFTVTVIDTVDPMFTSCPDDMVVDALGECDINVSWTQPTATDNCTANPSVFSVPAPGDIFHVGYTYVNVFVQDPSGNQDTCRFKVTVLGPPLGITNVPQNQTFIGCEATATWAAPTPTGVCGPIELTANHQSGDTFPIGVTTVTYTLTDTLDHVTTASFTITVTESVAPVFTCPVSTIKVDISGAILADQSQFIQATDTIATCDGVELSFQLPQATDDCSTPVVTQEIGGSSGQIFPLGMHQLAFKAKDTAGNTAMCQVQIEVLPLYPLQPQVSDAIACKGDDISLSATIIPGAEYSWAGPHGPFTTESSILVTDLDPTKTGIYTVLANVNGCLTPLDSALVRIGKLPVALDDQGFEVATNEVLQGIDVLLNDVYEQDDYTVTLSSELPGLVDLGNGKFDFQAGSKNGKFSFIYELCSKACPDLCDMGVVTITVREIICGYIPNIITPNNDEINDFLVIPCLDTELYPNNELVIYNQWGDRVFEAAPYSNNPQQAWKGTLFGEEGKNLPDATYFYIFKPTPDHAGLKGYIEIFR